MKEEIIPNTSNKFLFVLGPCLAMLTAMMTSAVIPWGDRIHFTLFGQDRFINLQIADINIGKLLYIFGVVSMGVYGILIGGWASNNKFSLIAAMRGASQVISYELPMGIVADRFADAHRLTENERDHGRAARPSVLCGLPAPWIFYFPDLRICRM